MDLGCLDVVGAEDSQTADQRGFIEVLSFFKFSFLDEEMSHNAINSTVKRMERSPMVV